MRIREVVLSTGGANEEFMKHVCAAFNARYKEMVTPLAHLALLMHPFYRAAMQFSKKDLGSYQQTASNLLRKFRKGSPDALARLGNQLREYVEAR